MPRVEYKCHTVVETQTARPMIMHHDATTKIVCYVCHHHYCAVPMLVIVEYWHSSQGIYISFEEITSEVSPRTSAQEDTGITYEQGHTEKLKSD